MDRRGIRERKRTSTRYRDYPSASVDANKLRELELRCSEAPMHGDRNAGTLRKSKRSHTDGVSAVLIADEMKRIRSVMTQCTGEMC